jgi:hypothetical protein
VLRLDADSYKVERLFDSEPALGTDDDGANVISPGGNFGYQNRIFPINQASMTLYGGTEGAVYWNADVVIPMLIDLKRQCYTGELFSKDTPLMERMQRGAVWMSLTPMEMITQRSAVKFASGTVVIGGLGLGWLLKKVCAKPGVENVILVEKSQELLDWYGYEMCAELGAVAICDDIYNQLGKHGVAAKYLLDIWHLFTGAANDEKLRPFRRSLKRRIWCWGLDS